MSYEQLLEGIKTIEKKTAIPYFLHEKVLETLKDIETIDDTDSTIEQINQCILHNTIFHTGKILTEIERRFEYRKRPDTLMGKFNTKLENVLLEDTRITPNFVDEIKKSLHKKEPNNQSRERNDLSTQICEILSFNNIKFRELNGKLKECTDIDPTNELDSTIQNLKKNIETIIKVLKEQGTEINEAFLPKVRELIISVVLLKGYEYLKTMHTNILNQDFLGYYGATDEGKIVENEGFFTSDSNQYDLIAQKKYFDSKKFLSVIESTIGEHPKETDEWRSVGGEIKKSISSATLKDEENKNTESDNEETKNTDDIANKIISDIDSIIANRNLSKDFYKELIFINKTPRNFIDPEKGFNLLTNKIKELVNECIQKKTASDEILKKIIFYTGIKQELEKEKNANLKETENENKEFRNSIIGLAKEKEYDELKINKVFDYIKENYDGENVESIIKYALKTMNNGNITDYRELLVKNHELARYKIDLQTQKGFLKNLLDTLVKSKNGQQSEGYNLQDFGELSEQDLVKSIIFYCSIINILDQKNKVADEQAKIRRGKVELFRLLGGKD